jgi:purine nucleoside phosphorylase
VTGSAVALVLTHAGAACREAGARLFPGAALEALSRAELRPSTPFAGRLFEVLGAQPRGAVVGLVVPVVAVGEVSTPSGPPAAPGLLAPVADHVCLEARGPLTGRWPAGVPREFPSMSGIYQPALVRPPGGARVYSSGVVAAGVADARRLTRYEARAVREGGWPVLSDSLVPAAIVAAYYGLRLAACGCVQAPTDERE